MAFNIPPFLMRHVPSRRRDPQTGTGSRGGNGTLTQSAKDSLDSEVTPEDFTGETPVTPVNEKKLVDLVLRRLKESAEEKRVHEYEWLVNTAMYEGNQWVAAQGTSNRLVSLKDPSDPYRVYHTTNLIAPLIDKLCVRATSSEPDVDFTGFSSNPEDQGAAEEARDILEHYSRQWDMSSVWQEWVLHALKTSTCALKIWWDASADALLWTQGVDGTITYRDVEGVGDLKCSVVPGYEMFPAPRCRGDWHKCPWIIHAQMMPIAWFQDTFGKHGRMVEPSEEGDASANHYFLAHLDSIAGDEYSEASKGQHAMYIECWERPGVAYPKGRLIRVGGDVLLSDPEKPEEIDWPCADKTKYPFVFLGYRRKSESLWHTGAIRDLVPLQRQLNNVMSRWADRVNSQRPVIFVQRGTDLPPYAFQSRRAFEKIPYTGEPPIFAQPPDVSDSYEKQVAALVGQMEDVAGVHPLTQPDSGVPAVTAASGIELIRDEDTSQITLFVKAIESAAVQMATVILAECRENYKEPRYLAVSQDPNAQNAGTAARDFNNLMSGGKCHVEITPGSALPKTPAARDQKIMELVKAGMFQPQNLPSLSILLELQNIDRSDVIDQRIEAAVQAQMAQQAQAAQQPNALAQQQAEHDAATQLQKNQHEIELQTLKNQGAASIEQQKDQGRAELLGIENNYEYQAQEAALSRQRPTVNIALKGDLGNQGTIAAEQAAGLPSTDTPASLDQEAEQQQQQALEQKVTAPPQPVQPKAKPNGNPKSGK